MGKVKKQLPKSPRKRKAIVVKLAMATGVSIAKKKCYDGGNKGLSSSTVQLVKDFYINDSVSRQAPGRKDFVTVKTNNKKDYIQKRHMLYSLKESYAIFIKDNPSLKIGFSKFCSLRPVHVMLSSDMPRNVCLCSYHENVRLICECLSKEVPDFPQYSGDFADHFVCDPSSESCMLGKCKKCLSLGKQWIDDEMKKADIDEPTVWYQWERTMQILSGKGKKSKRKITKMQKVCKEGAVDDVFMALEEKLPQFLEHVFVKRKQAKYFEERIQTLPSNVAALQVDFAENYTCKYQDEIQSVKMLL